MRVRRLAYAGIAGGLVVLASILLIQVPTTIGESAVLRLTYDSSPAWEDSICILPGVVVDVSWFDSSRIHNATNVADFGPLFTATVTIWGAAEGLAHPLYNETGPTGSGSFQSEGVTHVAAFDTRPTEAVAITLSWTIAGHLLTGPTASPTC